VVVSEVKSLSKPVESRNPSFSKNWLIGDDGITCMKQPSRTNSDGVMRETSEHCSASCNELKETPKMVERKVRSQKKLTEFMEKITK
jgi:hypothetical protein